MYNIISNICSHLSLYVSLDIAIIGFEKCVFNLFILIKMQSIFFLFYDFATNWPHLWFCLEI